ncbi:MAG: helix-turn-helix domain-containing protein [Chloroflexota bacterium]|nr:helix-turn-helix domain-containing protein [Chloroflexota bacterium]
MDDARIGRALRVLRRRRGLRQVDIAAEAGVSQATVSVAEQGHVRALSIATVRRLFAAVDAGFEGLVLWRGGAIDRILDERHAHLVGSSVGRLSALGWRVIVEATYSVYGERGSIDVLAGHDATRTLLVEEVKSELTSVEAVGRKTDEKLRLARRTLCRERFGWTPLAAARVLVLPDTDSARRSVARYGAVLDAAFPVRGRDVTQWLRRPEGDMSGILFVSNISGRDGSVARGGAHRVRRPSGSSPRA